MSPPIVIVLTASTSDGYSLLFKLLADAGDEVLVPRPELSAVRSPDAARSGDDALLRSRARRRRGRSTSPASRARSHRGPARVLVVSPNNPTGSFVSADELDRLAAICRPRGIAIIADEVFADYELEAGAAARAGRAAARDDVLSFALGGLSKSVGLPQVKLGWIAVGGPDRAARPPRSSGWSSSAIPIWRCRRRCSSPRRTLLERGAAIRATDRVADRRELPRAAGRRQPRVAAPAALLRSEWRLVRGAAACRRSNRRGSRAAPAGTRAF